MCKSGKGAEATSPRWVWCRSPTKAQSPPPCDKVLAAEPDKVAEYRAGRDKLFGFFVGQVMKAMGGKGNPKVINEILRAKLSG